MANYTLGAIVQCGANITVSGSATDPTTLKFNYKKPSGSVTTYVLGSDAQLVKTSTGVYYVNITTDEVGKYFFRFQSTGVAAGAGESDFAVETSNFS